MRLVSVRFDFCDAGRLHLQESAEIGTDCGLQLPAVMKEPSAKRKRTLALHERALRFSAGVNACCPQRFSNLPSSVVWGQLVRAADGASNNLIEADDATSEADFLS